MMTTEVTLVNLNLIGLLVSWYIKTSLPSYYMIRVGGREVIFVFVLFFVLCFFVFFLTRVCGSLVCPNLVQSCFFLGSVLTPFSETMWSKNLPLVWKKTHLEGFNFNPADKNRSRVCFSRCIFSSKVTPGTIMSSIYNIHSSQCSPLSILCKSL